IIGYEFKDKEEWIPDNRTEFDCYVFRSGVENKNKRLKIVIKSQFIENFLCLPIHIINNIILSERTLDKSYKSIRSIIINLQSALIQQDSFNEF
ncbi:22212_t:CDS:2, partial [Gigaspora margarita]